MIRIIQIDLAEMLDITEGASCSGYCSYIESRPPTIVLCRQLSWYRKLTTTLHEVAHLFIWLFLGDKDIWHNLIDTYSYFSRDKLEEFLQ